MVGRRERPGEVMGEVTRTGVQVRLEDDVQRPAPAPDDVRSGADDGRDLGGVVRVVVDDGHAHLRPPHLETAPGPGEPGKSVQNRTRLGTQPHHGREVGRARVEDVVVPRHRELEVTSEAPVLHDGPRSEAVGGSAEDPQVRAVPEAVRLDGHPSGRSTFTQRPCARVVTADHQAPVVGDRVGERLVRGLDPGQRAVEVEVVRLDVRHDRHVRPVGEERAVALVSLHDESLTRAEGCVGPELCDLAPRDEGRVVARCDEGHGQHRCRRRLAVRAGDRNPSCAPHENGEGLGPMQHRQPRRPRGRQLDVVRRYRGGDDDGVRALHVGRVMTHVHTGAAGSQRLESRAVRRVRARHRDTTGEEQPSDPGHAGSADRDEVHPAQLLDGWKRIGEPEPGVDAVHVSAARLRPPRRGRRAARHRRASPPRPRRWPSP